MKGMSKKSRYAILFAFLSVAGVSTWCWLLFRAGCAGDAESGTQGNQLRAMGLERSAAPFLIGALLFGLAYVASLKNLQARQRVLWGVRLVLFGLPIAWVLGVQAELLALRICF